MSIKIINHWVCLFYLRPVLKWYLDEPHLILLKRMSLSFSVCLSTQLILTQFYSLIVFTTGSRKNKQWLHSDITILLSRSDNTPGDFNIANLLCMSGSGKLPG